MATTNLQTRNGNRIVVTLDGKQVGSLQSVSLNDDFSPEPASGIGSINAFEYVPTMARHTVNVQSMVLNSNSLRQIGITAENGAAALQGLVFDIEVFSRDDGSSLRKYKSCYYASGSVEINKHAIVMASGVFMALDVQGTAI